MATDLKTVPKGLHDQEVESGSSKQPPIPYIPVEDDIGEQVKKSTEGAKSFKIKLSDETGVSHKCWDGSSNEAFLVHIISALSHCNCRHYFLKYTKAERAQWAAVDEVKLCRDILAIQGPPSEDEVELSPKQENLNAVLEKEAEMEEVKLKSAGRFFTLYENLLGNIAQKKWNKIVNHQVGAAPWTNLNGNSHVTACKKSMQSFEGCITLHLLTVFTQDSSEQQDTIL